MWLFRTPLSWFAPKFSANTALVGAWFAIYFVVHALGLAGYWWYHERYDDLAWLGWISFILFINIVWVSTATGDFVELLDFYWKAARTFWDVRVKHKQQWQLVPVLEWKPVVFGNEADYLEAMKAHVDTAEEATEWVVSNIEKYEETPVHERRRPFTIRVNRYHDDNSLWGPWLYAVERHVRVGKLVLDKAPPVQTSYRSPNTESASEATTATVAAPASATEEEPAAAPVKVPVHLNATDENGYTQLMKAIYNDKQDIMESLLAKKVNVNTRGRSGLTALSVAVNKKRRFMTRVLLRCKADPNTSLDDGTTPLMTAANNNDLGIVKQLLAANADVNATNSAGKNVAVIASDCEPDIQQAIIDAS